MCTVLLRGESLSEPTPFTTGASRLKLFSPGRAAIGTAPLRPSCSSNAEDTRLEEEGVRRHVRTDDELYNYVRNHYDANFFNFYIQCLQTDVLE